MNEHVNVPCEEISPARVRSVKFFKAGLSKEFYKIDKDAEDQVSMTPSRKYGGVLGQSSPHLVIYNVQPQV